MVGVPPAAHLELPRVRAAERDRPPKTAKIPRRTPVARRRPRPPRRVARAQVLPRHCLAPPAVERPARPALRQPHPRLRQAAPLRRQAAPTHRWAVLRWSRRRRRPITLRLRRAVRCPRVQPHRLLQLQPAAAAPAAVAASPLPRRAAPTGPLRRFPLPPGIPLSTRKFPGSSTSPPANP